MARPLWLGINMALDPNKFYIEDKDGNTTEVKRLSKDQSKAASVASRDRFRKNREKYRSSGGFANGADSNVNSLYR